ncbi:hypothetical protein ACFLIM_17435 [Nonomuraea sp. M3C6]|uniref:Uncharacterized protein n=1 Tax=Nonomuraea marmarensis TaxID=3351344 RepID=A0ABW7AC98_9ACTN
MTASVADLSAELPRKPESRVRAPPSVARTSKPSKVPQLQKLPARYVVWGDGTSDEMCLGIAILSAASGTSGPFRQSQRLVRSDV